MNLNPLDFKMNIRSQMLVQNCQLVNLLRYFVIRCLIYKFLEFDYCCNSTTTTSLSFQIYLIKKLYHEKIIITYYNYIWCNSIFWTVQCRRVETTFDITTDQWVIRIYQLVPTGNGCGNGTRY